VLDWDLELVSEMAVASALQLQLVSQSGSELELVAESVSHLDSVLMSEMDSALP